MKRIAVFLVVLFATISIYAQNKVPAAEDVLKPVYAQAAKENKNVLLIFHASWCGWCRKMDNSLQDQAVKPLIDKNYVTTHLTVYETKDKKELENPGALQFLTKHGGADKGLPYWLVLDKNGKLLASSEYKPGENTGCPASAEEVGYFTSVLKKTSSLNDEELKIIQKRFRMNDPANASAAAVSH